MVKNIVLYGALIIVIMVGAEVQAEDFQYWSSWEVKHRFDQENALSVLTEGYLRDDMSDDYVYLGYLSYLHSFHQRFSILAQGYYEDVQDRAGDWNDTESLVIGPVFQLPLGTNWNFKALVRAFYQVNPTAQWDYYRPRFAVAYNIGKWSFMVEDEMRVDLTGDREDRFFRNRVFLTCLFGIAKKWTVGFGYLRQEDKIDGSWSGFNGIRSLVKYEF